LICFRIFCVSKAIELISTSQSSVHSSNDAVVVIFLLVSSSSSAFQVLIEKLFRPGAKKEEKLPRIPPPSPSLRVVYTFDPVALIRPLLFRFGPAGNSRSEQQKKTNEKK
jgi:hypothetical protein